MDDAELEKIFNQLINNPTPEEKLFQSCSLASYKGWCAGVKWVLDNGNAGAFNDAEEAWVNWAVNNLTVEGYR